MLPFLCGDCLRTETKGLFKEKFDAYGGFYEPVPPYSIVFNPGLTLKELEDLLGCV